MPGGGWRRQRPSTGRSCTAGRGCSASTIPTPWPAAATWLASCAPSAGSKKQSRLLSHPKLSPSRPDGQGSVCGASGEPLGGGELAVGQERDQVHVTAGMADE